jgi:hypothetical protein
MYQLYLILKDRNSLPTDQEIKIASAKRVLDAEMASNYLGQVDVTSTNLVSMFAKQLQENAVSEFSSSSTFITYHIIRKRHSTWGPSRNMLPNGSLPVINLSKRLIDPSSAAF